MTALAAADRGMNAMPPDPLHAITALRAELWGAGYRPLAVLSHDHADPRAAGKAPLGRAWTNRARCDPPEASLFPAVAHARNTGILCDGLRVVDIDVDEPELAGRIRAQAIAMLGESILRFRENSGRCLLLYRAATGSPSKRVLSGRLGKIEVLGHGQQFVSHGTHPSGALLHWHPDPPEVTARDTLLAVTENQITGFLSAIAPLIEAKPEAAEDRRADRQDGPHAYETGATADILDVLAALGVIPNGGPADWEAWNRIGMATWAASGGSVHGFNAWAGWSARSPAHDDAACRERWRHYPTSPPDKTGAGKLYKLAAEVWPGWQRPSETQTRAKGNRPVQLRIVNPVNLELVPIQEREWIVTDWLPARVTTANYGDGGTGKTLLAQQLQTACATGAPWCGLGVMRCRSLGVYCEDEEEELHRRQWRMCAALGLRLADLDDMRWLSGAGADNALVTFTPDGRMQVTERFEAIAKAATDFEARLVVLDTAADLFGGNENDRHQVRQFIGLLTRLAMQIDGAVLLNAHPSRTGLNSGTLDGGSTAWSNSVRSRWSLARPQVERDDAPADTSERLLTRRKANYASIGDSIRLRWVAGVLAPITAETGIFGSIKRQAVEHVFLELLNRCEAAGVRVSDSKNAMSFAPRLFARRPDAEGYRAKEFEQAMVRLFAAGRIAMAEYGRKGDARQRIVRAP